MAFWYQVEIYKRDVEAGMDEFSDLTYVRCARELTAVIDSVTTATYVHGLFISRIKPTGSGLELAKCSDAYLFKLYRRGEKLDAGYQHVECVKLDESQMKRLEKFQKIEVEQQDALRRIEEETATLNAQKRKVVLDRNDNAKKRFKVVRAELFS